MMLRTRNTTLKIMKYYEIVFYYLLFELKSILNIMLDNK